MDRRFQPGIAVDRAPVARSGCRRRARRGGLRKRVGPPPARRRCRCPLATIPRRLGDAWRPRSRYGGALRLLPRRLPPWARRASRRRLAWIGLRTVAGGLQSWVLPRLAWTQGRRGRDRGARRGGAIRRFSPSSTRGPGGPSPASSSPVAPAGGWAAGSRSSRTGGWRSAVWPRPSPRVARRCSPSAAVGRLAALGLDAVQDRWPGEGPLGGVLTAGRSADGPRRRGRAACDLGRLDASSVSRLSPSTRRPISRRPRRDATPAGSIRWPRWRRRPCSSTGASGA